MSARQSSSRRRRQVATASRANRESILIEHDLFGKPASTFPDHALAAAALRHPLDATDRLDAEIAAVAIARAHFAGVAAAMRAGHGALEDILDALAAQDQHRRGAASRRLNGVLAHALPPSSGIGSSISVKRPVANGNGAASSTLTTRSRTPRSASVSTRWWQDGVLP